MVGPKAHISIAVAAALSAAMPAAVEAATSLAGRVVVPPAPPRTVPRSNPYPGRASALPHAAHSAVGAVTDAVVYIETIPADIERPAPAQRPRLEQRNQSFVPRVLAVPLGATVEFPNQDPIYHNVFSVSPVKRFDLGKYPKGQSRRVQFDKPGLVQVFCDIHSDMAAFILVVSHPFFARPDAEGRFELPALPEGAYVVRVWHPDFGELAKSVTLTDGMPPVELRY